MKQVLLYISDYIKRSNRYILLITSLFAGTLVFINYFFGLNEFIQKKDAFPVKLFAWYIVFLIAFAIPYLFISSQIKKEDRNRFFLILLLAPFIFALKVSLNTDLTFSESLAENNFWNHIIYWPVLLIICGSLIFITWKGFHPVETTYGLTTKNINWKPYIIMLAMMIPLIALAATQPDFQSVYPKLKNIQSNSGELQWWQWLLFEFSYGSDFFTIEFFFRGFLILAFIKWAGKDAILPMACFYCTIHFGKPLGECISSYFGGILLGIVVYNTRSIWGGLLVHLGIAWMMEAAGYIVHSS
ncbi:MAG TPA: CPBP family intramembrane metalloprotease [Chitinophagaceae bacterium]|nr:CPBP family intramembrane metalloprotease [Chitinophagaceae bacterium]